MFLVTAVLTVSRQVTVPLVKDAALVLTQKQAVVVVTQVWGWGDTSINYSNTTSSLHRSQYFYCIVQYKLQWKPVKFTPLKVNNRFTSTA